MLLTRQQLILELLQEHPELLGIVFSWMRVNPGSGTFVRYAGVEARTPDLNACRAAASTAPEHVFALQNPQGEIAMLVILVVQMEVSHDSKLDWPLYVWNLRASQACTNVCLLVIPADVAVDEWAWEGIQSGPHRFGPMVLSPRNVPALEYEGEEIADNPAACVLAALLHALDTGFPERCAHRVKMAEDALQKINLTHALDCRDLLVEPLLTTLARVLEFMEYARADLSELTVDDELAKELSRGWSWRQGMLELLLRQLRRQLGALPAGVEQRVRAATNVELFAIGRALVTEAPQQALDRLRDRSQDQAQMRALRRVWDELVQRLDSFARPVVGYTPYLLRAASASHIVAHQLHLRFGAPVAEMTEVLETRVKGPWHEIYRIGERLLTKSNLEETLKKDEEDED